MRRFFKRGMPMAWQDKLVATGVTHESLNDMVLYFSRLENQERLYKVTPARERRVSYRYREDGSARSEGYCSEGKGVQKGGQQKKFSKDAARTTVRAAAKQENGDKWCSYHKTKSHNTSNCFSLKKKTEAHKRLEEEREQETYPTVFKEDEISSEDDCKLEDE